MQKLDEDPQKANIRRYRFDNQVYGACIRNIVDERENEILSLDDIYKLFEEKYPILANQNTQGSKYKWKVIKLLFLCGNRTEFLYFCQILHFPELYCKKYRFS